MVAISKEDSYIEKVKKDLSRSRTKEFSAHSSKAHCVAWNCTGKYIASGSLDKTAIIQSFKEDRLSREFSLKGHEDAVDQLAWHPTDPNILSTVSSDKTLRLWDIRTPQKTVACISTKGEVINMTWKSDGGNIALGNKDDLVCFVDYKTHKIVLDKQFDFEVNEIGWNHYDKHFYLTSGNGCIHILDYPSLEPLTQIPAHTAHCICLKFSPDKEHFATGGADALINIWDASELACLRSYSRLEWPVRTISFNHNGKLLAAGSEDLVIDIASTETGEKVATVSCNAFPFCVAWHPTQDLLAYVTDDKSKHADKHPRDTDKSTGMYLDFIRTVTPLLLLFMTEECVESIFVNLNLLDVPCLKLILSKVLGYAIVGGSVLVKLPQILKIYGSSSVVGLSLITFLLETFCCMSNVSYNFALSFPFSTWGENFFILVQLVILVMQYFYYTEQSLLCLLTPILIPGLSLLLTTLPHNILAVCLTSAIPLMALSKVIQIKCNFQNGHTGQLSFLTSLMNMLGCLARLFTVVQEVDDTLILINVVSVATLNTVIVLQFLLYWNAVIPDTKEKEQ